MYGNTDSCIMDAHGCITYMTGDVDQEQLDSWWVHHTYSMYRALTYRDLEGIFASISRLASTSGFEDLKFLLEMDEYDREEWIRRAHQQCHKEWLADSEVFPPCGLHESFKRIRALRKERAKLKKMNLG